MNMEPKASAAAVAVPTEEQIVARARSMVPMLLERQAEVEARTFYSEEVQQAFAQAGFFRMLTPRKFGGFEHSLGAYCRVVMALASGCPSTGWQFNLGASHGPIVGSMFGDSVLSELFGDGDFVCAATIAPQGTATRTENGDFLVNGVFNYASGIPYSGHFLGHAIVKPSEQGSGGLIAFVAPRALWRRCDDWGKSLGLKGSGSHSVEMIDARVPARYVLQGADMMNGVNGGAPRPIAGDKSLARHGRLLSMNILCAASLATGMLKGAIDEYARLMERRKTVRPPVSIRHENDDYRRWLGAAVGKFAMIESSILHLSERWTENATKAADGIEPFSAEEDLRIATACLEIMETAWGTMQGVLWPTAGTSAAMDGEVLQRILRDMGTARIHMINILADGIRRDFSAAAFANGGMEPNRLWGG